MIKTEDKCGKCTEKLGAFLTYVPGMGESCIKCLLNIKIGEDAKA